MKNTFNKREIKNIISLYKRKINGDDIGKLFGCGRSKIYKVLRESGVKIRSTKEWSTKYDFNQEFLKEIDTPEKAYFLGFFCADGSFIKGKNGIRFNLAVKDKEILEKFNILLDSNLPITQRKASGTGVQDVVRLIIVGEEFYKNIEKYNIPHRKTQELCFPTFIPDKLMNHFIRGYFDGDGWLTFTTRKNRNNKIEVMAGILSTKMFITGLSAYLDKLDIKHSLNFTKCKSMELWRLQVNGSLQVIKFLDYLYTCPQNDIFLTRKMRKFKDFLDICIKFRDNYSNAKRYLIENNLNIKYNLC